MSEMSAEKKKEIEKYIIKSYFGGGKNVESLANGADVIKGTDDGYIPQLIVEVTYFCESEYVMIKWNIYGDSQQSSFSMHICREREIERNRCDSADSMVYAWEAWKSKILGKSIFLETNDEDLQKDKRIEELEKEINALRAEKEVMERHIQELESQNVSLAETIKDKKCIEFLMYSMVATHKPCQENTEITITGTSPRHDILFAPNPFDIPCEVVVVPKKDFDRTQSENKDFQDANEALLKRVRYYHEMAKQWEENYNLLLKKTGFDTAESLVFYLTNFDKNDTLLEVIASYISERDKANENYNLLLKEIHKWRVASECPDPEHAEEEINKLANLYNSAMNDIDKWKTATDCPSPSVAKSLLKHYCDENKKLQKKIDELRDDIFCRSTVIEHCKRDIEKWQDDTGCVTPDQAKSRIEGLENAVRLTNRTMIKELESNIDEWQKATGCDSPKKAEYKIAVFYDRIVKMKEVASIASNWMEKIVEG